MLEIGNTITEMRYDFNGLTSRLDTVKERISAFEDMSVEISLTEKQDKTPKQKQNIQELWDHIKTSNICSIVIPEEEESMEQKKYLNNTENLQN